ncbi:MAG: LysR family transcriptional regulator, partial [Dolichospermum sp.]
AFSQEILPEFANPVWIQDMLKLTQMDLVVNTLDLAAPNPTDGS